MSVRSYLQFFQAGEFTFLLCHLLWTKTWVSLGSLSRCEGLARISDQTERLDGFTGLMHVIYANPQAIIQHPSYISSLVFAVASWHIPPNENGIPFVTNEMLNGSQYKFLPFPQDAADLGQALAKLLTEIKTGIGEEHWEDIMKRTPINLRKLLSQTYGV